jgi:5-formyltetrahydrofolate cyclo-ligase
MNDHPITRLKDELRRDMRLRRQELSALDRSGLDRVINRALLDYTQAMDVASLSAFWPFDGEPDLRPALEELADSGVIVSLPVLQSDSVIALHQWRPQSVMENNRFHIAEPVSEPSVGLKTLDILLIPLVAWDRRGGRLGMGAGYYDRLLEPLRSSEVPLRLGIAYGMQEVPAVPLDEHDIPVHGLICEHGWTVFEE